jgi:hypothetical protein
MNEQETIEELGAKDFSAEAQQRILNDLSMRAGEVVLDGLSDEEVEEYEQIINGNQEVIEHWLSENDPAYQDTIAYQQLAEGFDEDPEHVPADKVYASMAWLQKKNPDLPEKIAAIKKDIAANLDTYK